MTRKGVALILNATCAVGCTMLILFRSIGTQSDSDGTGLDTDPQRTRAWKCWRGYSCCERLFRLFISCIVCVRRIHRVFFVSSHFQLLSRHRRGSQLTHALITYYIATTALTNSNPTTTTYLTALSGARYVLYCRRSVCPAPAACTLACRRRRETLKVGAEFHEPAGIRATATRRRGGLTGEERAEGDQQNKQRART